MLRTHAFAAIYDVPRFVLLLLRRNNTGHSRDWSQETKKQIAKMMMIV